MLFSLGNKHRTPGIHLTDVIEEQLVTSGVSKEKKRDGGGQHFFTQGYIWENIVCSPYLAQFIPSLDPSAFWRTEEIAVSMDGNHAFFVRYDVLGNLLTPIPPGYVIMTPDAVVLVKPPELGEFKWTTKSANMQPEEEKREWFYQALGYLMGLSRVLWEALNGWVTRVQWHVQFAVGDYRGSGPIYERWRDEFSPQHIVDNWSGLREFVEFATVKQPSHRWAQYMEAA